MINDIINTQTWVLMTLISIGFVIGLIKKRNFALILLMTFLAALYFRQSVIPLTIKFYEFAKTEFFDVRSKPFQPALPNLDIVPGFYAVTSKQVNVRVQPNLQGITALQLNAGDIVNVRDVIAGWARISDEFIGIRYGDAGNLSLWARANFLSSAQSPPEYTILTPDIFSSISQSDDIRQHTKIMMDKSKALEQEGVCKQADFIKSLGWTKLSNTEYFTLCKSQGDAPVMIQIP
jgi:hypothetical protein